MDVDEILRGQWHEIRERLCAKQLLATAAPTLSLRIPGTCEMWFASVHDATPKRVPWRGGSRPEPDAFIHAAIYAEREDAGAVALGGGAFGLRLADFGGAMPGVFDEQVRHLGCMPAAIDDFACIGESLRDGGNVVLVRGQPACVGTTASRLALNAELFEKCAKAYVLAVATGGRVKPLPWLVRYVANGRLMKDERHAKRRFDQGLLPEETRGY